MTGSTHNNFQTSKWVEEFDVNYACSRLFRRELNKFKAGIVNLGKMMLQCDSVTVTSRQCDMDKVYNFSMIKSIDP